MVFWDPADSTPKAQPRWKLPGPVNSLAFTPDGRYLALGNFNGTIYILRLDP